MPFIKWPKDVYMKIKTLMQTHKIQNTSAVLNTQQGSPLGGTLTKRLIMYVGVHYLQMT